MVGAGMTDPKKLDPGEAWQAFNALDERVRVLEEGKASRDAVSQWRTKLWSVIATVVSVASALMMIWYYLQH